MRTDIMVDIESLGKNDDSTIFQISAISFNIETGEHIDTFNRIANIGIGDINVEGSTLLWWVKNNSELFKELLLSGEFATKDLLIDFQGWLRKIQLKSNKKDVYLWGNGILFDNRIIKSQLESMGRSYPIFYRNDRDVRTILELASIKSGLTEEELKDKYFDSELTSHNALNDVINQINLVTACYNIIMEW